MKTPRNQINLSVDPQTGDSCRHREISSLIKEKASKKQQIVGCYRSLLAKILRKIAAGQKERL